MEFFPAMTATSVIVALFGVTWGWRALNWIWLRPRKLEVLLRQQGLSGNSYRLLFGDLIDTFRMKNEARSKPMEFSHDTLSRVDPFMHLTLKNHGKNSFTWFGPIPTVNVTEPELVREVFTRIDDFTKPYFSLVALLAPGLIGYNGEKWVKHRKLINPSFQTERLKLMLPAFYESCNEMMDRWEKMVAEKGSVELDMWPQLVNLTSDVISRATFSSSYEEGKEAFVLIEEQAQAVYNGLTKGFIPGWRYVPTKANRRFNKIHKQIRDTIKGIIETRMKEMEGGEGAKNDLLGTLLESYFRGMQHQGSKEIHDCSMVDELVDECKLFYLAGQEATASLLAFTMIMLSKYTHWQEQARREVLQTFGKNKPDFNELNSLKTVTMILHEVLRLYPPVVSILRKVETDTKLGELCLPAGAFVAMPLMSSHHDAQQWGEDALEFKPERFSEGISKATNGNNVYYPFVMGPRVCIGQNFAMIEVRMAIAMILQRFSFKLSPSYAHAPSPIITTRPQLGAPIVLHRHEESNALPSMSYLHSH